MRIIKDIAYTFDDVLLVPQHTNIESRRQVNLHTHFTRNLNMLAPIVSANMDTVTEGAMAIAIRDCGGRGVLHRFMSAEDTIKQVRYMSGGTISVGVAGNWREYLDQIMYTVGDLVDSICIDIAHGDCDRTFTVLKYIKEKYLKLDVICGNIATSEAAARLCNAGADAIKVGIGPGSMCTTRIVTGCGYPQLTAIMECADIARTYNIPVIADGGIRNSGDIVKALAAGASSVMIGNLFAGTDESPGNIERDIDGKQYKKYRGMASKDAMVDRKGSTYDDVAPEGELSYIPYKGSVIPIARNLLGGIRSGMTYNDAFTILELQENAVFRVVSSNTPHENRAHGLKK